MRGANSFENTLMLGMIEGWGRKGPKGMRWLGGITDSMDMGWVDSGSWWWVGRPGVLQFLGSQRVRHDWVTELNWTDYLILKVYNSLANTSRWGTLYPLLISMSEAFSDPFHTLVIKLCYPKALEWSSFLINLLRRSRIDTVHHKLSLLLPSVLPNTSSVQFSRSVMSDSLWPHELQHATPPCLSPTPEVYSNSCTLSWWCNPTNSSSVFPFSSCLKLSQHQVLF